MSRKGKKNAKQKKNWHHIFPKSRCPQWKHRDWNQVNIDRKMHDLYHQLFENRTPQEVLNFLTEYFWGGHIVVSEVITDANT